MLGTVGRVLNITSALRLTTAVAIYCCGKAYQDPELGFWVAPKVLMRPTLIVSYGLFTVHQRLGFKGVFTVFVSKSRVFYLGFSLSHLETLLTLEPGDTGELTPKDRG